MTKNTILITQTPSTGFQLSCTVCLSGMHNTAWSEKGKGPVNGLRVWYSVLNSPLTKVKMYLTVGAVMIPMNKIRHQLRGWLDGKTKICFRKNVFNSVSYKKRKKELILGVKVAQKVTLKLIRP